MTDGPSDGHHQGGSTASTDGFDLFGDIPRRAAEQAGSILGRLMQAFEPDGDRDPLAAGVDGTPDPGFTQLRAAFGRAVDLYLDLFQRTLDSYVEMMEVAIRRRGAAISAQDAGGVQLERRDGEAHATGSLFVHNYTGAPAARPPLRLTDLTAADGSVIPVTAVRIEVQGDDAIIEDRSTVRVEVTVDLDGAAPGAYFGHALAGEDAVPVRLVVTSP